ncbi:MAG: DUF3800 domain-containing protein [Methanothrix sp.]|nr:DUF3800 domain-containing protein [Methanothrix sp.]
MQIYLDESGSIVNGLVVNSSGAVPYFVLAALVLREDLPIKRCIKDIRRKKIKKKYKQTSELKFNDSDGTIRRRILECIGRTNNDIGYAVLYNSKIQHEVEPQLIYNEICRQLTYKIANNYGVSGQVEVIIDKSLYGAQRTAFNAHMADRSGIIVPATLGEVKVTHVDSKACPCIQAVDFIAGAINRKYRDNDDLYYQKIQHKISLSLEYEPD